MSSKLIANTLLGILAAFSLAACGQFLNEKKKEEQVIELSDDRLTCLNGWPKVIREFTTGDAKETEITESFDCLKTAFTYFRERTKGSMEGAYTDEDLRKFLGKYFLKKNNISPQLTDAVMKLKKALIGGSDHYMTKIEIDRLVMIMEVLKKESVLLVPHMKVLLTQKAENVNPEDLSAAIGQARSSLQSLLRQLDLSRSDYTFEDTQNLVAAVADFAGGEESLQMFGQIREWVPILEAIKILFFGERAALTGLREWSDAVNTVTDLYEVVLRYHYQLKDNTFDSPKQMQLALLFADRTLRLVEESHQVRKTGRLPFKAIDTFIDRLVAKKIVELPVSSGAIKDLYRKIVLGMLDPVRRGDDRGADAIERVHFLSLRRELNIFLLNQSFIDWIETGSAKVLTRPMMTEALSKFPLEKALSKITNDPFERGAITVAWTKFKALLTKERPVNFSDQGRAMIVSNPESLTWSWISLTQFNAMHGLSRGFMLGYGDDRNPVKAGCSEDDLIRWYADFAKVGIELKAFDPRSGNSGSRSFKEASFFSFSGNGDKRIDMDEMFEFISMLFAGGLGNVADLQSSMEKDNCATGQIDIFDLPMLKESCFKAQFRGNFSSVFNNLPGLSAYVASLDDAAWEKFYADFIQASRFSDPNLGLIESADMRTGVMIMHYVESLFTTYDHDRNGKLSVEEVRAAAPRFADFITQISPIKKPTFVTEAFVALVFLGKKPEANWDAVGYAARRALDYFQISSLGEADRGSILRVFSSLKAELAKPKTPTP